MLPNKGMKLTGALPRSARWHRTSMTGCLVASRVGADPDGVWRGAGDFSR